MATVEFKGTVTLVKDFHSSQGYGVDFYVEDKDAMGTVYLQVVAYDDTARTYFSDIKENDHVRGNGRLKVRPYTKRDGSHAMSLIVENPECFEKVQQELQSSESSKKADTSRSNRPVITEYEEMPF